MAPFRRSITSYCWNSDFSLGQKFQKNRLLSKRDVNLKNDMGTLPNDSQDLLLLINDANYLHVFGKC